MYHGGTGCDHIMRCDLYGRLVVSLLITTVNLSKHMVR
uniref:Uncharacterized protein n=1 Tax=Candidatus Methanogaster sp. ANME-2c ERB4 TaxID=2759911 RepID=A0A7G9YQU3_9EURY|nr:hypothetical protein BOLHPIDD_00018 [Methanosarcinales archaeon ANME-2c ERB4]